MSKHAWFGCRFLTVLILAGTGCGGPNYGTPVKVTGKVTVAGAPAKDANIIFNAKEKLPADKRTVQAPLKADGSYEVGNVYPADYEVFLQSTAPADPKMNSAIPTSTIPVNQDGSPITKPAKVPTDKNEFNFDF